MHRIDSSTHAKNTNMSFKNLCLNIYRNRHKKHAMGSVALHASHPFRVWGLPSGRGDRTYSVIAISTEHVT